MYVYVNVYPGHDVLAFKAAKSIVSQGLFQACGLYFQSNVLRALNLGLQNSGQNLHSGIYIFINKYAFVYISVSLFIDVCISICLNVLLYIYLQSNVLYL
jgi:hypothetical protein